MNLKNNPNNHYPEIILKDITNPELYKNIIDNSPDGIVIVNKLGFIKFCNITTMQLLGLSNFDDIIGKHFTKIGAFKSTDLPKYIKYFSSIIRGHDP